MARRIRKANWEGTPLGPMQGWSETFVRAVNAILSSPNAVALLWGADFRQIYNDRFRRALGVEPADCLGEPIGKCWPEVWEMIQPWIAELMDGQIACFRDQRLLVDRDSRHEEAWFDLTFSPISAEVGGTDVVLLSVVETTDKVRAEQALRASERRLAIAIEAVGGGLFEFTYPTADLEYVDPRWCDIVGCSPEEIPAGMDVFRRWYEGRMHHDDRSARNDAFAAFLEGPVPRYEAEFRLARGRGRWVWVRECAQALERDETGRARRISGLLLDITARREAEARAEHLARHDTLTGLANRTRFDEALASAIEEAARSGTRAGLVIIDLDHFKGINDTFGHLAGDEVLRIVASRIRSAIRGRDTASRFGGDEFAVVLTAMRDRSDVEAAAARLRSAVVQPARLAAGETDIAASFGHAMYPDDGSSSELLFACADRALYADKHERPATTQ